MSYGADTRVGISPAAQSLQSEYLVAVSTDGRITPRLAERWTRSADGREWTFSLVPRLRFHDGEPVRAADVIAMLNAQFKEPFQMLFHPGLRDIVAIEPIGDRQIRVRTRTPRVLTLDDLAEVPLGQQAQGRGLAAFVSGPVTQDGFTAHAAAEYFRGRSAVDMVEFRSHRSLRAAWAALMRDEIDALYEVNREAVEFVEREQGVRLYPFLRAYAAMMMFNVRKPALAPPDVRRALSRIVDRDAIIKTAYRGRALAAHGPLWPGHWSLQSMPTLATASRPDPARPLNRFRFHCLVAPEAEQQPFERLALVLQKQFADAGVDLELEAVSLKELMRRANTGDFESVLIESIGRAPTWMYNFWHSSVGPSPFSASGYSGADAELDAMQMARDDEELKRAVAAVYRKMDDDPPAIFIAWPEVARAVSTRFDVPVEKGVDIMGGNLWLWRPAKR